MTDNNEITRKPTGFQLKPENINKNGAPKKEESISGLVKELLHNKPIGQEKTYRELFAMRVMKLALEGDMTAIKEIWNRMEGVQTSVNSQVNVAIQNNYNFTKEEVLDEAYELVAKDKGVSVEELKR